MKKHQGIHHVWMYTWQGRYTPYLAVCVAQDGGFPEGNVTLYVYYVTGHAIVWWKMCIAATKGVHIRGVHESKNICFKKILKICINYVLINNELISLSLYRRYFFYTIINKNKNKQN